MTFGSGEYTAVFFLTGCTDDGRGIEISIEYSYDGVGNRLSVSENGTVIGTYADGSYHNYLIDMQGSTTNIINEDGTLSASYEYADFGETAELTDSGFDNQICYTGGVYDEATGLYYLNARYYDPETGRFISQDTYRGEPNDPGQWHLYAYCANNPINYVDPSGHASYSWVYTVVRFNKLPDLANCYEGKKTSEIIQEAFGGFLKGKMADVYFKNLGKYRLYRGFTKVTSVWGAFKTMYTYTEWCRNRRGQQIAAGIRKFYNKNNRRGVGHRNVAVGVQMKEMFKGRMEYTGKVTLGFEK